MKMIKCQNVKKCIQKDIKNVHSVKNMPKMLWMDGWTDWQTNKQSRAHMTKNREWLINDSAKVLEIKETKPEQKTQAPKQKSQRKN